MLILAAVMMLLSSLVVPVGTPLVGIGPAAATHNRATQLSWTAGGSSGEVVFHITFVARRSYYSPLPSVGDEIQDPALDFGDGTSEVPALTVVAADVVNDIIYTEGEVSHTYGAGGPFTASLSSCCRISGPSHVNNPDGEYRVETLVDLSATTASPESSIAPVVTCAVESVCTFVVPGTDPDGQPLAWRLATAAEAAGGSFSQPGGASINATTGRYTWDTTGATVNTSGPTYYSTQVIVENVVGGTPVSKVAVDFFIELTTGGSSSLCEDGDGDGDVDDDGDGLCDNWEISGIDVDQDGVVDLELYDLDGDGHVDASERSDHEVKDIYVELDYMDGLRPGAASLASVVAAFAAAPEPIKLHILRDDVVPFSDDLVFGDCAGQPCPAGAADFDQLKGVYFGTQQERVAPAHHEILEAKSFVFHYAMWANGLANLGTTSGRAEIRGNDFVVTLGRWPIPGGSFDQQSGTFMHELGHNLGLRHGGADDVNCKPNYMSVMNYTRQNAGGFLRNRALDYSREPLSTLLELELLETNGVMSSVPGTVAFGPGPMRVASATSAIDWSGDGDFDDIADADINWISNSGGCSGDGSVLNGHDDWANLFYAFQTAPDFADGVHSTVVGADELTREDQPGSVTDADADGVVDLDDNCIEDANPSQADADEDGIGDECDESQPPPPPPPGDDDEGPGEPDPPALCRGVDAKAFPDVVEGSTHAAAIGCLAGLDVILGLADGNFGGDRSSRRGQLASLFGRLAERLVEHDEAPDLQPLPATSAATPFVDVDTSDVHQGRIGQLASAGVLLGRDGVFESGGTATRAQIASMLVRLHKYLTGVDLPVGTDAFTDDESSVHEASINALAAAGVILGTSPERFSPGASVTRAQIASMMQRFGDLVLATG